MQKLSIKNIVGFRNKSDKAKKNFATALKLGKTAVETSGGGDYWVSSLSAISNCYKFNDLRHVTERRKELEEKYEETDYKRTKIMYKRNIDILYNYEDLDLKKWVPVKKLNFLRKHKDDFILTIKELQIKATPNHVFTFKIDDVEQVGAIWFIAKLNGFRKDELGMFTDILYCYLKTHFSEEFTINTKYCIAVDVFNDFDINYLQLEKREVPMILTSTINEIKKLM